MMIQKMNHMDLQLKTLILSNESFIFQMVPKKGLEPLHLSAYAPQAYMSTIPSPGHFF